MQGKLPPKPPHRQISIVGNRQRGGLRVPSWEAFGRRPSERARITTSGPASEGRDTYIVLGYRLPLRDRKFADSRPEGEGFEPLVPRERDRPFEATLIDLGPFHRGNHLSSPEGPRVRIRLPPAESHANFQSASAAELWRGPRLMTKATSTACAAARASCWFACEVPLDASSPPIVHSEPLFVKAAQPQSPTAVAKLAAFCAALGRRARYRAGDRERVTRWVRVHLKYWFGQVQRMLWSSLPRSGRVMEPSIFGGCALRCRRPS